MKQHSKWLQRSINKSSFKDDYLPQYHSHIYDLMISRGATSNKEAFLNGSKVLPWGQLKDIDKASKLVYDYIQSGKHIIIAADYDCDGATACTIMYKGLYLLGAKEGTVSFIVPNRFKHGYGLTPSLIETILETSNPKPDLIITVDNGTSSIDGIEFANKHDIEVLVTDHHLPSDKIPSAVAIVNPNQHGCTFISKAMAGCGVAFYLIQSVGEYKAKVEGYEFKPFIDLMDILALGTVADVVPLDLNNRVLVNYGLARIRRGQTCPGIRALFDVSNKDLASATTTDFGFAIAPRLNAAGRLDDMTIGIKCLLETDYSKALEYASILNSMNETRKEIGREMEKNAGVILDEIKTTDAQNFVRVVYGDNYHEGVMGIVAGRIKEKENLPTIVFAPTENEKIIKGSGRSIPNFHLRDALDLVEKRSPNTILKFGGHAMAAGLNIPKNKLNDFIKAFDDVANELFSGVKPSEIINHDGSLPVELMSIDDIKLINSFVWGQKWEPPLWVDKFYFSDFKLMGKDQNHVRLILERVIDFDNSLKLEGVWFNVSPDIIEKLQAKLNSTIEIAYNVSINNFRNLESLQIMVQEIKL
jgi:single-stranded-DNA-specific exonuclease